jgi:hypothetical protein
VFGRAPFGTPRATVDELVAWRRQSGQSLSFASTGVGTQCIFSPSFQDGLTGTNIVDIPY